MDAQVDDFFNEINEIAPAKAVVKPPLQTDYWEECYDDQSGHLYYWNMKTNEVTWDTPHHYKGLKSKAKTNGKYKPPPRSSRDPPHPKPKLYSIARSGRDVKEVKHKKQVMKRHFKSNSDSEDEKIELITSYGNDSASEGEPETNIVKDASNIDDSYVSDEDDGDILQKIQKRVQELKKESESKELQTRDGQSQQPLPSDVDTVTSSKTGIALIAGYSDSEEESEDTKPVLPLKAEVSHSTLFPISKPIDIKDFTPQMEENTEINTTQEFDNKAFKRKRRIGVALVNTAKKKEETAEINDEDRKGLGFSKDAQASSNKNIAYSNFAKGGVMFVKADILNPTLPINTTTSTITATSTKTENGENNDEATIDKDNVNEMYSTLKEKLGFLNVGRPDISPVQVMLIQAEMLFVAMNEGGLRLSYLQKWLSETCSELIKLEKDATPNGWLLQWDRQHKRYYYRNELTGASQWEYPTAPATALPEESESDSDAMDICTTPPPIVELPIKESPPPPPLPPTIRSPTPPPPPIISVQPEELEVRQVVYDVPLPHVIMPVGKFVNNEQPLPPGVDLQDDAPCKQEPKEIKPADPLNSELDSFYSDIAAISTTNNTTSLPPPPPLTEADAQPISAMEPPKKKKKSKVKLAAGLTMKKKGVVQLVEKWKTVQKNYND